MAQSEEASENVKFTKSAVAFDGPMMRVYCLILQQGTFPYNKQGYSAVCFDSIHCRRILMPRRESAPPRHAEPLGAFSANVVNAIARWTEGKEDCLTEIPNLLLFRRDTPTQACACRVEPSIVLVVQGAKQLLIGDRVCVYGPGQFLINSLDIPAISQTLEASPDKPCLGLGLRLDLRVVTELITQNELQLPSAPNIAASTAPGTLTRTLLDPFARLLALLDDPSAIPVLAPLIEREIHYRLLLSDQATSLWQIGTMGSTSQRIARAIDWLRKNYAQPFRIDDLCAHVRMSKSTLHHHFRQLTAMSPLQYQKWLRLHEARHLMLSGRLDAASAAFRVGYESPSQFSREYSRFFGAPPKREIGSRQRRRGDANTLELARPDAHNFIDDPA